MKQDENDENNKKEPTPVVGWKPYGKSQIIYKSLIKGKSRVKKEPSKQVKKVPVFDQ